MRSLAFTPPAQPSPKERGSKRENPLRTIAAIAYNELLLNSKRVAPYVLMIFFAGNAVLWWAKGPAVALGWATNSEYYIVRNLVGFSFITGMPIFNAVIMGDSVIRDFRFEITPLLFSKPISRAEYLLGKFCGSFLVLVCCQSAFVLTSIVLQAFRTSHMVVQPFRVWPYFKHFVFYIVLSHLLLAAVYFTLGTLTRNAKIVYGLAIGFYPAYIAYQIFLLKGLPQSWAIILDPLLLNSGLKGNGFLNTAEFLNQLVILYTPAMLANRALMILGAVACLAIAFLRFTTREGAHAKEHFSKLKQSGTVKLEPVRKFSAVAYNEVLLNSRRVAPYVVAALCAGNAVLWWGWGPATGRGVATNSEYFIAGVLPPYSFLFLPLYTALMMADPGIRDFRTGIDPLIFSKPVSRAEYLLGKFFGNLFVLASCQSAFVLTLFVLQWVHKNGVTVVPETKFLAYPKHFLVFVVISHMFLAAVYFTVGTMTRNAKIVYGLGIAFYPIYISYQKVLLSSLPWRLKLALDPLVMDRALVPNSIRSNDPSWLNQLVIVYDTDLIVNRVVMILLTAGCLTILYKLFSTTERSSRTKELTVINLSTAAEGVYYPESPRDQFEPMVTRSVPPASAGGLKRTLSEKLIPDSSAYADGTDLIRTNEGIRASVNKLIAALGVEFRLLGAERSLVVVMPLAFFLSIMEVAFYNIPADVSHSAAYATNTAKLLWLFLIGIAVFYTGEAMHRDREIGIEPVLWATPAPNNALLLSKFLATFLLLTGLIVVVGIAGVVIQMRRGDTPIDLLAYFRVYGIILLPGAMFVTAFSLLLNVVLRNKYLVYVVSIGVAAGLFYLYNLGYNHWSYNPAHYGLWSYSDFTTGGGAILQYRMYWVLAAMGSLALAHLLFGRKSTRAG
jgi:ABC-type transport system involved in multi-copper enzyme maturation permease subunit